MKVNLVSEATLFSEKLGGIYTAFLNNLDLLKSKNVNVSVNSLKRADITHIHSLGPYALYKLLTSKPVVISAHWVSESSIGTYKGAKLFQGFIKFYLRNFYNQADLILASNAKTKDDLQKLGVTKKIEVLPNPINTQVFRRDETLRQQGREKYQIANNKFVVLGVGQLIQRKGIETFVTIAQSLPDFLFVWVGGNAAFKLLNDQVKAQNQLLQNPPANLLFTGNILYKDMPVLYNMADAFLFPSYQETQGLIIIEAAACGLPLVLRDLPEYQILYKGSYISCNKNQEFQEAIETLYNDKIIYHQEAQTSKNMSELYSISKIGDKLITLYKELIYG